jgi:L-amino acid N-acyltransferase YncA
VYIHDAFTLPEFQSRGLYTALLSHVGEEVRARGMEHVYATTWHRNVASIRAMLRAGMAPCGTVLGIRLFSKVATGILLRPRRAAGAREAEQATRNGDRYVHDDS